MSCLRSVCVQSVPTLNSVWAFVPGLPWLRGRLLGYWGPPGLLLGFPCSVSLSPRQQSQQLHAALQLAHLGKVAPLPPLPQALPQAPLGLPACGAVDDSGSERPGSERWGQSRGQSSELSHGGESWGSLGAVSGASLGASLGQVSGASLGASLVSSLGASLGPAIGAWCQPRAVLEPLRASLGAIRGQSQGLSWTVSSVLGLVLAANLGASSGPLVGSLGSAKGLPEAAAGQPEAARGPQRPTRGREQPTRDRQRPAREAQGRPPGRA